MFIVNMVLGCTHEGGLFVSLDDLGNILVLLDEANHLEEITHLINEKVFSFSS